MVPDQRVEQPDSRETHLLLSCEHGGNLVPQPYQPLFAHYAELLQSHRGWDPGTRELGEHWARELGCGLRLATTTRLLIDLNRSENHPRLFSEITAGLPTDEQEAIKATYYRPHREEIFTHIQRIVAAGERVIHLALHSFTPELGGVVRQAEIGLLYDPSRARERELCRQWKTAIATEDQTLRVRMNYPYRGTSDGLTTALRKSFSEDLYLGIELEVNQQAILRDAKSWERLRKLLPGSFATARELA